MITTEPATQNYIEILEKTNQQLSLWYNPYGLLVGALAVLSAFLAICFAFIIWRQGREYREAFKSFLEEQRKIVDGELRKSISDIKVILDEQIKDYNAKLKDLKDLKGQTREEIETEINKLKKARESLDRPALNLGGINYIGDTTLNYDPLKIRPVSPWIIHNDPTNVLRLWYSQCISCGGNIPNEASYCPQCGTKK